MTWTVAKMRDLLAGMPDDMPIALVGPEGDYLPGLAPCNKVDVITVHDRTHDAQRGWTNPHESWGDDESYRGLVLRLDWDVD